MTVPMTPVLDFADALLAAARADVGLRTALGGTVSVPRIYVEGSVPQGVTPPYLLFGEMSDTAGGRGVAFRKSARAGAHRFHLYAPKRATIALAWAELLRVLRAPLVVAGHDTVWVTASLDRCFLDQDRLNWHGVGSYGVDTTRRTAG